MAGEGHPFDPRPIRVIAAALILFWVGVALVLFSYWGE